MDRGSGWRADSLEAEPGAWVLELSAAHLRELDACVADAVALVGDDVGLEALGVEHLPLGSLGAALRRLKAERLVEGPGIALVRCEQRCEVSSSLFRVMRHYKGKRWTLCAVDSAVGLIR